MGIHPLSGIAENRVCYPFFSVRGEFGMYSWSVTSCIESYPSFLFFKPDRSEPVQDVRSIVFFHALVTETGRYTNNPTKGSKEMRLAKTECMACRNYFNRFKYQFRLSYIS
jgi:hypothetical protein